MGHALVFPVAITLLLNRQHWPRVLHWLNTETGAAWAQAVGTVVAIAVAVYTANLPLRQRERERIEARTNVARLLHHYVEMGMNLTKSCNSQNLSWDEALRTQQEIAEITDLIRQLVKPDQDQAIAVIAVASMKVLDSVQDILKPRGPFDRLPAMVFPEKARLLEHLAREALAIAVT